MQGIIKENAEKREDRSDRSGKIYDFDKCMRKMRVLDGKKERKLGDERFLWEKMEVGIFFSWEFLIRIIS